MKRTAYSEMAGKVMRSTALPACRIHARLFVFIAGLIFAICYAIHSDVADMWSTKNLALLRADWPYRPRVLVAWVAYRIFGGEFTETVPFIGACAFIAWVASVALLPMFSDRLNLPTPARPFLIVSFLLILLTHYCLPNVNAPYYIYDLPSIPFYLLVFVLLTSESRRALFLGAVLTLVFYLNRESVSVAVFQAFGWWLARAIQEGRNRRNLFALGLVFVTFLATLLLRHVLLVIWDGDPEVIFRNTFYWDNGQWRFVMVCKDVITEWGARQQVIALGFGALIYIPFLVRRQNLCMRLVLLASVVPLVPLLFLGNFTELRAFNEFIPVMACLLATTMIPFHDLSRKG